MVTLNLSSGSSLFREGDPAPGLPFIVSGEIELVRWTAGGCAVRMHRARADETFAEASVFAGTCHCEARAMVDSTVELLPREAVLRGIANSPALAERLASHLAHALVTARRLIELRAVHPLPDRVMLHLADVAEPAGELPPGLTLASIADDLGVTPPALYRALAALDRSGRIERPGRGRVRIVPAGPARRRHTS